MELRAGQRIDRYVLIEPLGEGGQGAVWKAQDPLAPDAPCALKLVPVVLGRPNDLERARREARALAQLEHPSLVRSSGLFEDLKLGVLGIAMELVKGTSLKQLAREGRLGAEEKSLVLEHVARALDYLHKSGVVHRDVKLDNVLVRESFWDDPSRSDGVKVVDLGIAAVSGSDRELTQEGTVVGTLAYLAPELLDPATFEGEQSSPRVDVFAFGVMGWLLLSGQHPSGLPANSNAVENTRTYRATLLPGRDFPVGTLDEPWRGVLTRCLAPNPAERLPNAGAVLDTIASRPPDSVVVRPSRDGAPDATAVATPQAMLEPTALAEQAAPAQAPTVAIAPAKAAPPAPQGSKVLVVFTLLVAVAIGVAIAMKASVEAPAPARSASASVPSARAAKQPADAGPVPEDAAPEGATSEAAPESAAALDPCPACPSGRSCGEEGCDAPLEASEVYALRLGRVDGDSFFATYRTAEVCVSISGRSGAPVCMPLAETLDAGVTAKSLRVDYVALVKDGLDVTVQHSVPGQGAARLAHKTGVKPADGGRRELLCKGLLVEDFVTEPDVQLGQVVLYLDDAGGQPTRCP